MSVRGVRYRDSAKSQGNTENVVIKKSCQEKSFLGKAGVFENKSKTFLCACYTEKGFFCHFCSPPRCTWGGGKLTEKEILVL